ncbi:hypothetical protein V5799_029216 [Amblyomma americanum]|uniref:Uncharacterized protein n=1 Tax=Amblyomma americanum TaxID=6943 RepID=A0AAQ4ERT0_AMBAM
MRKAAEAAQPAKTLPQPVGEVMPQWDGSTSFQPTQYPAALLDPQQQQRQQQSNLQEGWPSAVTGAANGSTAGSAVHCGGPAQGDNYWNWAAHQEPGAGGDTAASAPMQSWNSWGAAQEVWTGRAQPPDPATVGGTNEAAVAPVVNDGTSLPPQLGYTSPPEGGQQQYGSGGVVAEGALQEGWAAPHWSGDTNQWPSNLEQQQFVTAQAQWQWQPADASSAVGQWQGYGSQLDPAAAGPYESTSLAGYAPLDGSLQQQQQQPGQDQLAASSGENVAGDMHLVAYSSGPAAVDGQGGSEGTQHLEATLGDNGMVSMFFQDGGADDGQAESREGGPTTHDQHAEEPGPPSHQQQTAATGIAQDAISQVAPAASSDGLPADEGPYSAKPIRQKLENLNKHYRKLRRSGSSTGSKGIEWPFYWLLLHSFLGALPVNDSSLEQESVEVPEAPEDGAGEVLATFTVDADHETAEDTMAQRTMAQPRESSDSTTRHRKRPASSLLQELLTMQQQADHRAAKAARESTELRKQLLELQKESNEIQRGMLDVMKSYFTANKNQE